MAIIDNRVAGIVAVSIDGVSYAVKGSCKYRCNPTTKSTVEAQSGIVGFKEMPKAGRIAMTLMDAGDLSVAAVAAITSSTITVQLANHKGVSGAGMWFVDDAEADAEEGTFEAAFEGRLVEEFPL